MGRLLGLGFMFGAKDKGAVKVTEQIGGGFEEMSDSIRQVGKQTSGLMKFGNAINALNFLQVHRLTDAMEGLAEKAGLGDAAQANQIESWGVQFGKTYREATAGLGEFKKAVDEYKGAISGVSFTLEVDAAEMTKAIALLTKSGAKLEDYGLNVREIGGLMQAGILSGDQLADTLTSLAQGYGLGAKGAGLLLDEITKIGEVSGAGADAIRQMPEALKAADAAIAGLPEGMAGSVEDTVKSLTVLAASTQRVLGGPYEQSFQAAVDVMQKLTESRRELARTFAGLGGEFPEMTARLAETYGSIDKAFEVMADDPALFIQEIQKVYASLDETRKFRLLEQLPESIKFMVKAGAEGAKVIESMRGPIEGASGALGRMAKGASGAARTFSEQMDLMEERFANRLNKMTSQTDAMVVKRQAKAWKRLGDTIDNLRKKGGPFAELLQLFLDVRRHGLVHGILPSLEKLAGRGGILGGVAKWLQKVAPMTEGWGDAIIDVVTSLGPMIIGFKMLGGFAVLGKVFGGLGKVFGMLSIKLMLFAGIGYLVYKNWDLIAPVLKEIWGVLKKELGPAFKMIKRVGLDAWEAIKGGAISMWEDTLKPFGKWFMKNLPMMIATGAAAIAATIVGVKTIVKAAAVVMAGAFVIVGKSAKAVAVFIKEGIGGAMDWVIDMWEGFFFKVDVGLQKTVRALKQGAANILEIVQFLVDKLPKDALEMVGLGGLAESVDKGVKQTLQNLRRDITELDEDIKEKEDARRRSNAEADRLGMERLKRMETAGMDVRKEFSHLGKELSGVVEEGGRGIERVEKMKARIYAKTTEALARRGRETEKPEPKARRRGKGKRPVEAARQEAAAEAQVAVTETFMVRGRGGAAAEPLEAFLKDPRAVKLVAAGVEAGVTARDKRARRGGRTRAAEAGGAEREGV